MIVVTNQAVIARGLMTEADLGRIHRCMEAEAALSGGRSTASTTAHTTGTTGASAGSPSGDALPAQRDFHLDLRPHVLHRRRRAGRAGGEAAGCPFAPVTDQMPLLEVVQRLLQTTSLADSTHR